MPHKPVSRLRNPDLRRLVQSEKQYILKTREKGMLTVVWQKLNEYVSTFIANFSNVSLDILIFFAAVVVLFLVLLIASMARRRSTKRDKSQALNQVYEHLIARFDLDTQEQKIMQGISEYLERDEPHYLLMTSQQIFAACVRKMRKIEDVSESTFDALRIKLRFTPMESKKVPASSAEIPKGSNLVILLADKTKIKGEVSAQGPRYLVATIEQENDMPPTGTKLTVYFHNDSGIFSFQSEIDR